jgi:hypothetical protein
VRSPQRAAAADPSDASIFANFALFYKHCRKDPVRCRDMMLTAYGIQPDRPWCPPTQPHPCPPPLPLTPLPTLPAFIR